MASKVTQVAVIGIGSPPLPHPMFLGDQLVTFHGIQCPLIYRGIALLLCKGSVGVRNLREAETMNLPTFYKMRARGPTDDSLFLLSIFLCPFALLAFGIRFCSEREKER